MPAEKVILLHGIWRSSKSMVLLAHRLRRQGFEVLNLDYPSTRLPLETLTDFIHAPLQAFVGAEKFHLVCHSMGGLLARAYITKYRPAQLARVVMLGTPNHGSEVADFLKSWRLYRAMYGPAGQQLTTQKTAEPLFGAVDYELGVIAGNHTLDFVCTAIIGQENDGKVSVASTKLEGMKAHHVVPVSHVMLTYSQRVAGLVIRFLKEGKFD